MLQAVSTARLLYIGPGLMLGQRCRFTQHGDNPANTRRWTNVLLMLDQRRSWTNIKPVSKELLGSSNSNSLTLLISYTEGKVMYSKVKSHVLSPRPIKFVIFYFPDVLGVCFVIRDEPYGVNTTLTVGPTIRLISILIHCVHHWPVIELTLAQRLVFVWKWLHRRIPNIGSTPHLCIVMVT